ncbi:MAG: hypothetical protein BMS9Abin20_1239 [Acidimicrobiia bacterium]|nr:MAG: hypothetical protein BMS9Abin20_1239 [Acidimicrobiia bacterium]
MIEAFRERFVQTGAGIIVFDRGEEVKNVGEIRPDAARRRWVLVVATIVVMLTSFSVFSFPVYAVEPSSLPDSVGVVDTSRGYWYLRDAATGKTTSFYYGNPGDTPFTGDWNCDGVDTPGLYRRSDGYVYLRNSNSQGVADVSYFFGDPGDIPLAGDFDGSGCDTVSLYRPSNGRFYVINKLGSSDAGLGTAEVDYVFGDSRDIPFVGDFDGDGIDTFGMRRLSTGAVFLRNDHSEAASDVTFTFGDPGDVMLAGAWSGGLAPDTLGLYRSSNTTFYLSNDNATGAADISYVYGARNSVPIAGRFGDLPGLNAPPVNESLLVSEFTTYHPAGQNRNININLIADKIDGAVVLPGEVFSLNDYVGERKEEDGFVRAGAIIGGRVVCCESPINVGGGSSQFATTFYNAIFFGGYEDVEHHPHSLYFSRYPVVREATLGFPGPDVRFRNDTAFPVTIKTEYTATSITVKLYGDNEGRKVTTWTEGSVSSSAGGTATVYRTISYANGTSTTQSWTHTYKAKISDGGSNNPPPPTPEPPPPSGPSLG